MSALFIFLLFVLNIGTIFAIIVLYLRQGRLAKLEQSQTKVLREMEELMSTYLLEMKEDHSLLIEKINHIDRQKSMKQPIMTDNSQININQLREGKMGNSKKEAAHAYKVPFQTEEIPDLPLIHEDKLELSTDTVAKSLLRQVEHSPTFKETLNEQLLMDEQTVVKPSMSEEITTLYEEGHSIEDIARKLDKGKTEIELLLKFKR